MNIKRQIPDTDVSFRNQTPALKFLNNCQRGGSSVEFVTPERVQYLPVGLADRQAKPLLVRGDLEIPPVQGENCQPTGLGNAPSLRTGGKVGIVGVQHTLPTAVFLFAPDLKCFASISDWLAILSIEHDLVMTVAVSHVG